MKHILSIFAVISFFINYGCHSKSGLGLNENASVKNLGNLPENPLLLNAITSSIYPANATMTVLYGNDLAYDYAALYTDGNYPVGAVLYEVTWLSQPDEQWFGANIPETIKTIERIEFKQNQPPQYTIFEKGVLKKSQPDIIKKRTKVILSQKMAVSP